LNQQCKIGYRDAIKASMEDLAKDPSVVFVGYNLKHGSRGYKTLTDIDQSRIIETPVAENLMAGLCMGVAIEGGFRPVLIYERHDFVLNALDALVNHLDLMEELSRGQLNPRVIIRAIIGRKKPVDPGPQHLHDLSVFFKSVFHFPVYDPRDGEEVLKVYNEIKNLNSPAMVIERSELYRG
jgi:pyruvate/2-oxoglutarate/acetoin dehydrogenase E1 component